MKKIFSLVLAVCVLLAPLCAQKTSKEGLYHTTLENGLELFVFENPAVPLAYIEIAVKTGGISQTKETAGLFHLYEHMMFKGNSLYKDAASIQKAIQNMGIPSWNGSTGGECVNYFFTVPSDSIEKGLAFWSAAIQSPSLDINEFENEKKVVMSEISGYFSQPAWILDAAMNKAMFPKFPWRLDPCGSLENIENATIEQLKSIQKTFYVPNNTALFVGGDVKYDEVLSLVKKTYGNWQKGADSLTQERQLEIPFTETQYLVMPYPEIAEQMAQVCVQYRGPDTSTNIDFTYAADVWGNITASPQGNFKQTLVLDPRFAIPDTDYISAGYSTSRENGCVTITAIMLAPEQQLPSRAADFAYAISNEIVPEMISDPLYFTDDEFKQVKTSVIDNELWNAETAEGFLSNARFWWNTTSTDYYFTYNDKMCSVQKEDLNAFLEKYLNNKPALVTVVVNPSVYELQKEEFAAAGFTEITAENAFWFNSTDSGSVSEAE